MCDNAAQFNKAKSQVHSDSLRLRKLVDGFEDPSKAGAKGGKGNSPAAQQAMVKLIDDLLSLTNEKYESWSGLSRDFTHFSVNVSTNSITDYSRTAASWSLNTSKIFRAKNCTEITTV